MTARPRLYWLHTHFLFSTGATIFIFEVIKQLSKKYHLTVLVEKTDQIWKKRYAELGVRVEEVNIATSTSLVYWALLPVFLLILYRNLKKQIPSNSVVISSMFPMNLMAALLTPQSIFYCFEPFAFFYDLDLIRSFSPIKQVCLYLLSFIYSPIDRYATSVQKTVLAINPAVGEWIKKIYTREPTAYTYLGVDTTHFKPTGKKLLKTNTKQTIFFHSTDYSTLKGTQFLLNALTKVKNKTRFHVYISETVPNPIVKARYLDFLTRHRLQNTVTFLGHLTYADLPAAYRSCDVYCFTGSPESRGATAASLSVLEAQAAGLAVIRSIGNNDEVLQGKTGYLVDPRLDSQLAQIINTLIEDKQQLTYLRSHSRSHILKNYTWPKVATTLIKNLPS